MYERVNLKCVRSIKVIEVAKAFVANVCYWQNVSGKDVFDQWKRRLQKDERTCRLSLTEKILKCCCWLMTEKKTEVQVMPPPTTYGTNLEKKRPINSTEETRDLCCQRLPLTERILKGSVQAVTKKKTYICHTIICHWLNGFFQDPFDQWKKKRTKI